VSFGTEVQATGHAPGEMPGMSERQDGRAGVETAVSKEPLPDHGNVEHDYGVAMTTDEIRAWRKP
jgi:hypothetical protein